MLFYGTIFKPVYKISKKILACFDFLNTFAKIKILEL